MIVPNEPPDAPQWASRRCVCTCLCAGLEMWAERARDMCGCCYRQCGQCLHDTRNEATALRWEGDDA